MLSRRRKPKPASTPIALPDDADLVAVDEGCQIVGGNRRPISRATFYRLIEAGIIPKPIHISPNCARWPRHEIVEAVHRRIIEARAQ